MRGLPLLSLLFPLTAAAAGTLYEWTDESGSVRYGSRPPVGVTAKPAGERLDQLRQRGRPVACSELRDEHLPLIDAEIARVKKLSAGFGPGFEFTPEAKQTLINELLIHRSALVTGRPPSDFAVDQAHDQSELRMKYERELAQLRQTLQQQAAQLQEKQFQLDKLRREAELTIQQYRSWHPGLPPYPRY